MALSKAAQAALRTITTLDIDVKKTYRVERKIEKLSARLRGKPTDYRMWDRVVTSGDYPVPVRMFAPSGDGPFPLIIFYHGGGWVTGGIENYTGVCADLAEATGCAVALVDYRLAPEHKFPAAPEDCYAVAREFFLGGVPEVDPEEIVLMGDSAGGNLAAVVSLMARDRGEFRPRRQILMYPATYNDHSENSPFPSMRENGRDYLLSIRRLEGVVDMYCSSEQDRNSPYFAPALAGDLTGQPRTLIITAEYCPLRDEGEAYGRQLREAGCKVEVVRMRGALHAYLMLPSRFAHVRKTYKIIRRFLRGQAVWRKTS